MYISLILYGILVFYVFPTYSPYPFKHSHLNFFILHYIHSLKVPMYSTFSSLLFERNFSNSCLTIILTLVNIITKVLIIYPLSLALTICFFTLSLLSLTPFILLYLMIIESYLLFYLSTYTSLQFISSSTCIINLKRLTF